MNMSVSAPVQKTKSRIQTANPWNVIVLDDPVNLMEYVTKIFQVVLHFSREKAEKHMIEVHMKGKSVVWSGDREKAELFVSQLQAHQLKTIMEKSE